jgi:hypothetical protein
MKIIKVIKFERQSINIILKLCENQRQNFKVNPYQRVVIQNKKNM